MSLSLESFWERLETHFPLGGPRKHLSEVLGSDVVRALESAGALKYRRVADRYPCPQPGGDGCPRHVVELADGRYEAVCGNRSPDCPDEPLTKEEAALLAIVPEDLCAAVGKALQVRTKVEALPSLRNVYRVGTFIPEPGLKHPVYLAARVGERAYAECLDALRANAGASSFAVLVPTETFISEEVQRRMASAGSPVIALADAVGLNAEGALAALVDPLKLFAGVGRPGSAPVLLAADVVAVAYVGAGRRAEWRSLDRPAYEELVASAEEYDVFADELMKTVSKGKGAARTCTGNLATPQFRLIYAALEKRGGYDPGTGDEDSAAAKQIFQRARKAFDMGSGQSWALFKTEITENNAIYRFEPDVEMSFAFVFLPRR